MHQCSNYGAIHDTIHNSTTMNHGSKYRAIHDRILPSHDLYRGNNHFYSRIARDKCESFKKIAESLMYCGTYLGLVKTITFFNHELASPWIMISLFFSNGPIIVTHRERRRQWMMRKRDLGGVGDAIGVAASEAREYDFKATLCEKEETTTTVVTCPWNIKSHLCRRQP